MLSKCFRLFPAFKGKRRLARFFLGKQISTATDVFIRGKYDTLYTVPNISETVGFEILVNGIYEPATIDFMISQLKENMIFLDLGANIGAITVPICKRYPDARAVCVEAAPWLFNYLQKNVHDNGLSNVTTINVAISDKGGVELPFFSPSVKFGKGSLAPVFADEGVMVKTITLSELARTYGWDRIGFIKIDIEGFEYFAFVGGSEFLKMNNAPNILFEFVDWAENSVPGIKPGAAQEILMSYGYRIYPFNDGKLGKMLLGPLRTGSGLLFATKQL